MNIKAEIVVKMDGPKEVELIQLTQFCDDISSVLMPSARNPSLGVASRNPHDGNENRDPQLDNMKSAQPSMNGLKHGETGEKIEATKRNWRTGEGEPRRN